MSVDKKFLIERQGKQVVLYQGLLDLAHEMGLVSLRSEVLQFPNMDNGGTCYAMATAIFKRNGEEMIFQDFADANAGNVTPAMKNCIPRMAATRAKARCLRDGTNCGVTAFEELGDDHQEEQNQQFRRGQSPSPQRDEYTGQRPPNVDPDGVIHDGIPSRPPLSTMQQAVDDFRSAARAINEVFGHPSFKNSDLRRMVKFITESGKEEAEIGKLPELWDEATSVLRIFKRKYGTVNASDILRAVQERYQTDMPMVQFTGGMWADPFPPAAGSPNSAVIDAASRYQTPETAGAR